MLGVSIDSASMLLLGLFMPAAGEAHWPALWLTPKHLCTSQVVDEYNRRDQEIKELENELEEKKSTLEAYRQNMAEVLMSDKEMCFTPYFPIWYTSTGAVCVSGRLKNVGWTLWSSWWNRLTKSSPHFSALWIVQAKLICTQRKR